MLRKEKRREGAIREAGRKPACLRPRRRGGLRFASPLRSSATQVSAVGRPGCRGRQPLHSAPVMASRKRLRRSRRILRKNDSSTPLRMTNVGCVPAVGAHHDAPGTANSPSHNPRRIRTALLPPPPGEVAAADLPRGGCRKGGRCPSALPKSGLCGIGRSPLRPGLPDIILIFIVSAKRSLRNRLPREKCGGFAILANPPHYLSRAPSSRRAPFFFILHAAGFPAPHPP